MYNMVRTYAKNHENGMFAPRIPLVVKTEAEDGHDKMKYIVLEIKAYVRGS